MFMRFHGGGIGHVQPSVQSNGLLIDDHLDACHTTVILDSEEETDVEEADSEIGRAHV